jgi:hypothetical protein
MTIEAKNEPTNAPASERTSERRREVGGSAYVKHVRAGGEGWLVGWWMQTRGDRLCATDVAADKRKCCACASRRTPCRWPSPRRRSPLLATVCAARCLAAEQQRSIKICVLPFLPLPTQPHPPWRTVYGPHPTRTLRSLQSASSSRSRTCVGPLCLGLLTPALQFHRQDLHGARHPR